MEFNTYSLYVILQCPGSSIFLSKPIFYSVLFNYLKKSQTRTLPFIQSPTAQIWIDKYILAFYYTPLRTHKNFGIR